MDKTLGRYEIRRTIGRGAAGTVYEARDTVLDRRVAMKVVRVHDDDPAVEEILARFRQEAQVASRMSHPSVVQVHDYGEVDGQAFIVMEFVDGETLKARLDRGDRLAPEAAVTLMTKVLLALEHCHRQEIVHRDIKPANIMLPREGGIKLTDFGIARIEDSELTIVGAVMGSPAYMSPEQFTAREPVDLHTDIWSSAVVLYEMLTGTRPFVGDTLMAMVQSVMRHQAEPPSAHCPAVSHALDQAVLRGLRKVPSERYPSAAAFAQALQDAIPRQVDAAALAEPADPLAARRPDREAAARQGQTVGMVAGVVAMAVLAAGAAAWVWMVPHRTPPSSLAPLADRIAGLPCSTVAVSPAAAPGHSLVRGIIGVGAPHDALAAILGEQPAGTVSTAIQTFPAAPLACQLAELVRANAAPQGPDAARLSTTDGRTSLMDQEDIRIRLAMPDFDGEVRLEDLTGTDITHLMEADLGTPPRRPAGTLTGLGRDGDDLIGHVSAPYGTDILVAIVSSQPLFSSVLPPQEAGAPFIAALQTAIAQLRQRGGRVAADALVLTTSPR